jgi:hypothetical protein
MNSLVSSTYRQLIEDFIDWELVKRRCLEYPAVGKAYRMETLRAGSARPPYYCHYMAWRLGTWKDEAQFLRLEELFSVGESLPGWEHERPLLISADFADFWSLVWQLQVAEYLTTTGSDVRWAKSGPDLSVLVDGERWFVECYAPRKSFGLLEFLTELLDKMDPMLRVHYDMCMPFQLPRDSERTEFLDSIFATHLNPERIADAKNAASKKYPVVLYAHPSSSLKVYVEGDDIDAYTSGIIPSTVGSPDGYLKVAVQEAANAKRNSNALNRHRPNLVAVNYLLSTDYQLATSLRRTAATVLDVDVGRSIDALTISVVGIDQRLTKQEFKVVYGSRDGLSRIGELADVA